MNIAWRATRRNAHECTPCEFYGSQVDLRGRGSKDKTLLPAATAQHRKVGIRFERLALLQTSLADPRTGCLSVAPDRCDDVVDTFV